MEVPDDILCVIRELAVKRRDECQSEGIVTLEERRINHRSIFELTVLLSDELVMLSTPTPGAKMSIAAP